MKRIFQIILVLIIGACLAIFISPEIKQKVLASIPLLAKYEIFKNNEAQYVRQIITKDSATSRTIMWQSDISEKDAAVEIRKKGSTDSSKVISSEKEFVENKVKMYIHAAVLNDLTPETEYEYRIVYDKKSSPWYSLVTAGEKDYKVLIFPDSQSSDYTDWKNLAQLAWKNNQDAKFFINMGDLVDNGEDNSQWRAWFNAVSNMEENIPVAPIMGNHETYNLEWKMRKPESYLNLFEVPSNGYPNLKNQFYSFDYGDVHYTVLNTQLTELKDFYPNLAASQIEWVKKDLSSTNKKWKVVLMHKDVLRYPSNKHPEWTSGISDMGEMFMPIFDENKVDLVLTAHYHTYRRRGNIKNFQRDLQGPLYIITGVAGNVRYPNLWANHTLDEYVAPQPETDNYLTMEILGNTLKVKSYLGNGKELDEVEITK